MTNIWRKGNAYVAAMRCGPYDTVVITTCGGRPVGVHSASDYDKAIDDALKLAGGTREPVKVVPMSLGEAVGFCRIPLHVFMADKTDEEWRDHCIKVCTPALANPDPRVRADATEVLTSLGAMPSAH